MIGSDLLKINFFFKKILVIINSLSRSKSGRGSTENVLLQDQWPIIILDYQEIGRPPHMAFHKHLDPQI